MPRRLCSLLLLPTLGLILLFSPVFLFRRAATSSRSSRTLFRGTSPGPIAMPPISLNAFVRARKEVFLRDLEAGGSLERWTVVMGNEAGDLDSLASALAFAYLSTLPSAPFSSPNLLPLHQIRRADLPLRPENALALQSAELPPTSLSTLSDLPEPPSTLTARGASYALVDHNRLGPAWGQGKVRAVMDHHIDEGLYEGGETELRRVQVPVGSCASLVVQEFREAWERAIKEEQNEYAVPTELVDLLISAIVIDTANLREGGKAQPVDHEAFRFLLPLSSFASPSSLSPLNTTAAAPSTAAALTSPLFDALSHAKSDVTSLSTPELIRRDYKQLRTSNHLSLGLASSTLSLKHTIRGDWPAFWSALDAFAAERALDALLLLTSFKGQSSGKHRREVLLLAPAEGKLAKSGRAEDVVRALEANEDLRFGKWKKGELQAAGVRRAWVWNQGNTKATRKQVAPAVQAAVEALGADLKSAAL